MPCNLDADADILDDLDDPVGFQVLEDDLRRVPFRAVGWKVRQAEVVGNIQIPGLVPSGAIEDDDSMACGLYRGADVAEVPVHFGSIGPAAEQGVAGDHSPV